MAQLLSRISTCAAKIETTPGTAESLTSTEAFFATSVSVDPAIEFTDRQDMGTLSALPSIVGGRKGTASLTVEATGGATNLIVSLLQAAGFSNSGGVLTPTSTVANQKTLTIGKYENGRLRTLKGAMCSSVVLTCENAKPASWQFNYDGIWAGLTDASMLALPAIVNPPVFSTATVTVGGHAPKISKFTLSINNTVKLVEDITSATGYSRAIVTERKVTGSIDPEGELVASWDVYGELLASTLPALAASWGTTGNAIAIAASDLQYKGIKGGERDGIITDEIDFQLCATNTGNNELTITLS